MEMEGDRGNSDRPECSYGVTPEEFCDYVLSEKFFQDLEENGWLIDYEGWLDVVGEQMKRPARLLGIAGDHRHPFCIDVPVSTLKKLRGCSPEERRRLIGANLDDGQIDSALRGAKGRWAISDRARRIIDEALHDSLEWAKAEFEGGSPGDAYEKIELEIEKMTGKEASEPEVIAYYVVESICRKEMELTGLKSQLQNPKGEIFRKCKKYLKNRQRGWKERLPSDGRSQEEVIENGRKLAFRALSSSNPS